MKLLLPLTIGVLLAACGDDAGNRQTHDAAVGIDGSGAIDAPADGAGGADAPMGTPVTVTVTNAGTAVMGATVYFLNADYSQAGEATTDANGSASHVMAAGGSVTVVRLESAAPMLMAVMTYDIHTIEGVKPGDHLEVATGQPGPVISVNVTAPADGNAIQYDLFTTCGSDSLTLPATDTSPTTTSTAVPLADCGSAADMVVIAGTGSGAGVSYTAGVAVSDGGTVALTNTYSVITTGFVTVTDAPAQLYDVDVERELFTTRGDVFHGEVEFSLSGSAGGSAVNFIYQPAITGTTMVTEVSGTGSGAIASNTVIESGTPSTSYTLDYGAALLPQITATPTYDVPSHTVSWTEAATGGATATESEAVIFGGRSASHFGWEWTVVQARNGASVVYPVLPTDVQDFNAMASDSLFVSTVRVIAAPISYDLVRPEVFAITDPGVLVTGAAGRAVIEEYDMNPGVLATHPTTPATHASHAARRRW